MAIATGTSKTNSHTSQTTTPLNSSRLSSTTPYSSRPISSSHMHIAHGVHLGVQARLIDGTLEISRLRAGQSKDCAGRLLASLGVHPGMDGLDEAFASTPCLEFVSSERLGLLASFQMYILVLSRYTCQPATGTATTSRRAMKGNIRHPYRFSKHPIISLPLCSLSPYDSLLLFTHSVYLPPTAPTL